MLGFFANLTWLGLKCVEMGVLSQYSIVCQVPGAEPYTICSYSGTDLTRVLGITPVNLPEGHHGWIQVCGEASIRVSGKKQDAYADFRPNKVKYHLAEELSKPTQERAVEALPVALSDSPYDAWERLSQLPPLLMEAGDYCALIREARDVFVNGHFYACVAMCGISLERFQRDRAVSYGATRKHKMRQVRSMLQEDLLSETLELCEEMANLRNDYAHGHGLNPKEDALKSLKWMHSFIDNETSLMRNYEIIDGTLHRNAKR
jgi:hypothetical protein